MTRVNLTWFNHFLFHNEVRDQCVHRFHRRNVSSLSEIREQIRQFPGGSVDLDLDSTSGLAILTLNNADRMNAMTGRK